MAKRPNLVQMVRNHWLANNAVMFLVTDEPYRCMKDIRTAVEQLKAERNNMEVQKALELIDKIFSIYRKLETEYKYSIGSNLVRAGLSIANNLAEGNGKKSIREKKRYFDISSDSARECVSVFNVLKRQNLLGQELYKEVRSDAREITSMIRALIGSQ